MRKKKDVLFLTQFFYPEYVTVASLAWQTAQALRDAGFGVDALCGYPKEYSDRGGAAADETRDGINIRRLKYIQTGRAGFVGRIVNFLSFTAAVFLHLRRLRDYRCVIVYPNPPILLSAAVRAAKKYGCKVIFAAFDIYPEIAVATGSISAGGRIEKLMNSINEGFAQSDGRVLAISEHIKKHFTERRKIDASRVDVIPVWYEDRPKIGNSGLVKRQNGFPEDGFLVTYLGNMGTCQDMDVIMEAARLLRGRGDIGFVLAGHGNKLEQLKTAVKTEKLENVRVMDYLHGEDYERMLFACDCCLVSLVGGLSGLCEPSKTYAGMMAAKPIITVMDPTDISEDIERENAGFAVKCGDAQALAAAITRLADNRAEAEKMGENARKLFLSKYEKNLCLDKYVALVKKTLEGTENV